MREKIVQRRIEETEKNDKTLPADEYGENESTLFNKDNGDEEPWQGVHNIDYATYDSVHQPTLISGDYAERAADKRASQRHNEGAD